MKASQARLDIAVGAFLLLAFATLMALAIASTNGRHNLNAEQITLSARFSNIGELRVRAPVKIGGVTVGEVASVELDRESYEALVRIQVDGTVAIPADSSIGIYTAGLLGDRYLGISPGGDPELLKDGGDILFTQSAVVLEELISKFVFNGNDDKKTGDATQSTTEAR